MAKKTPAKIDLDKARMEYVGCLMSNLLYNIKHDSTIPADIREKAASLMDSWDGVSKLRLNNPIVALEMKKALGL